MFNVNKEWFKMQKCEKAYSQTYIRVYRLLQFRTQQRTSIIS